LTCAPSEGLYFSRKNKGDDLLACTANTSSINSFKSVLYFMKNGSRLSSPLSLNSVSHELNIAVKLENML